MQRRCLYLIAPLLVLTACRKDAPQLVIEHGDQASFARAVKGHDLFVQRGGAEAQLRLVGIHTFDPLDRGNVAEIGKQAAAYAERELAGGPMTIELVRAQPDPRGRYLAYVSQAGVDFGKRLIEQGLAAYYNEYAFPRESDYLAAENEARSRGVGMWANPAVIKRLKALRQTWAAVRTRRDGTPPPTDPLLP